MAISSQPFLFYTCMNIYNNKYDILASTIKPNPSSVKYWADLASNPYGGDLKYFNGEKWVYVNNKLLNDVKLDVTDIPNAENLCSYGVSWPSGSLNPYLTRIGNLDLHRYLPIQSKMRGCTLADDGTVNHYFNADWTANEDGSAIVKDGSDGMVMIEIPEFYTKFYSENGVDSMRISEYPLEGYTLVKKQYVSAYEVTTDRTDTTTPKLASVVNTTVSFRGGNNDSTKDETDATQLGKPTTALSRANFRKYARNRASGTNWNMFDFTAANTVWLLYTIEYANWNCQLAFNSALTNDGFKQGGLGNGVTSVNNSDWSAFNSYYPLVPCGTSDSLGNNTGEVEYTLPATFKADTVVKVKVPRYRGIENPFGHIFKNVDGIIFDIKSEADGGTSIAYVAKNEAGYADTITENFTELGAIPRTEGYVGDTFLGTFIPTKTGGSSTTGRCDYFYTSVTTSSLRTLFSGGYAPASSYAGLGSVHSGASVGSTSATCGSRLVYRQ